MGTTKYFTRDGLRFLEELKSHNEKAWFEANKSRFETGVRDPAMKLVTDIAPKLKKVSKHFVADTRSNGGSVSRIYRDTRFSKDKSPYKTAMFIHFFHGGASDEARPGLYLHIEPGGSTVGGGIWNPAPAALEKIRRAIVDSPAQWKKARAGAEADVGCTMRGESLKRVPKGFDPEHPFAEDLKRKDFGLSLPLSDAVVTGGDLIGEIERGFKASSPVVAFVCRAVGLPF